jgi:UTP:GlnB (protein PII) uridylyltransferase
MTVGERAEDVFYVTDESSRPLEEARRSALAGALQRALGPREAAA